MLYLMIENPGVCPEVAFTTLGASTKTEITDEVPGLIGRFGSGANLGTLTLLREGINPVIYSSLLRLEFSTKHMNVESSGRTVSHQRVQVRFSGKDAEGKSRSSTDDLGWVLAYGQADWQDVGMSLREYVSNAIDACLLQGTPLKEVGKVVKLAIVGEDKLRAKQGYTRIFVPVTPEVQKWYNNLGRWFLHFSEPELLGQAILPKNGRNINDDDGEPTKRAVVFRRGVRVREFESDNMEALFDYNLDNLVMDESRKVDDWKVMHECGRVLRLADRKDLAKVFGSMAQGKTYWEHRLSAYGLSPDWRDTEERRQEMATEWQAALELTIGDNGVLVPNDADVVSDLVVRKGYSPVSVPAGWMEAARKLDGVTTDEKVVSADDKAGREYSEPTQAMLDTLDRLWAKLESLGMTQGRPKPPAKVFYEPLRGESQTWGLYKDGHVMLHREIASEASEMHTWVLLEEIAHHITQATDLSRDFQTFLVRLASVLMR